MLFVLPALCLRNVRGCSNTPSPSRYWSALLASDSSTRGALPSCRLPSSSRSLNIALVFSCYFLRRVGFFILKKISFNFLFDRCYSVLFFIFGKFPFSYHCCCSCLFCWQDKGYTSRLVEYVGKELTLENVFLIAQRPEQRCSDV